MHNSLTLPEEPNYTRILSFDPGETTGIAFVQHGKFIWGMVATWDAFCSDKFFPALYSLTRPTRIVVEDIPPKGFPNRIQGNVFEDITRWFHVAGVPVEKIPPNRWKGLVERSKIDSAHIRDAADLGRWYHSTLGVKTP